MACARCPQVVYGLCMAVVFYFKKCVWFVYEFVRCPTMFVLFVYGVCTISVICVWFAVLVNYQSTRTKPLGPNNLWEKGLADIPGRQFQTIVWPVGPGRGALVLLIWCVCVHVLVCW